MLKHIATQFGVGKAFAFAIGGLPILAHAQSGAAGQSYGWLGWVLGLCLAALFVIVALEALYTFRHYAFTLNRLFARQRPIYAGIEQANWPHITVFIAAHNEEAVISGCIEALLNVDYPRDRLTIMPVNDRSTDGTRQIIDSYADRNPGRLQLFHRQDGPPGKAAALADATSIVQAQGQSELIVIFDADYLPGKKIIKQLVAPFLDPEIGAVMGRVVPQNAGVNLLTRLLDLERSGGYQVDQQARYNIGAVAQYGGTVGGIRLSALKEVGGWTPNVLAEDTDLTYRLLLKGWQTAYLGYAECYEEVPESWAVRFRQIGRWAKGHNQVLAKFWQQMVTRKSLTMMERVDGLALLGVFLMSPILLIGWVLALIVTVTGYGIDANVNIALLMLLITTGFACVGNFAAFFEVAAAVHLDGHQRRLRLLPLLLTGFVVSMIAVSKATLDGLVLDRLLKRQFKWDKTVRYRQTSPTPLQEATSE
ncbi:glycosyltransferase family 2 protein [Comamonas odontotermitis]|uniref:glycosyltransferase family 2 protein n=1 Tax=Comamonas odontotermitis TaxID=379895 RepID=UPI003753A39F